MPKMFIRGGQAMAIDPTSPTGFRAATPAEIATLPPEKQARVPGFGQLAAATKNRNTPEGQIMLAAGLAPQMIDKLNSLSTDSHKLGFKTVNEAHLFGAGVPSQGDGKTHGGWTDMLGGFGNALKLGLGSVEDWAGRDPEKVNAYIRLNGTEVALNELLKQSRATDTDLRAYRTGSVASGDLPDEINQQKIQAAKDEYYLAAARADRIGKGQPYLDITIPQARTLWAQQHGGSTPTPLSPGITRPSDSDLARLGLAKIAPPAAPAAPPAAPPPATVAAHHAVAQSHVAALPVPPPTLAPAPVAPAAPVAPPTPAGGLTPLAPPTGAAGAFQVPQAQNDVAPPNALRALLGVPANA
jgi:hypothetical protein